jgi:hypothetical protein
MLYLGVSVVGAYAEETYPKPVSESVEITAPGQLSIFSYPKYFKGWQGKLSEVDINIAASDDPDWDFEVTKGIWSLKIRKDGVFQAVHEGDIFAYRFHSLGLGRGSHYAAFNFGDINWSDFSVIGNSITWYDVYPQIDVTVRYFHDILKVEVVIDKELVKRIQTFVENEGWNPNEYVTARFDIVQLYLTSKPTLYGKSIDLYSENLKTTNQQVKFMRNGETLHKLRPVDVYTLDEKGERIMFHSDIKTPDNMVRIRTTQLWQLRQNQPGIAELSAMLEDVFSAPEGDLVIDPTKDFGGDYFTDTYLDENQWRDNFESYHTLTLGNYYNEKRILIGVDIDDGDEWDDGFYNVEKAEIQLYQYNTYNVSGTDNDVLFYKMTEDWDPTDVCWKEDGHGNDWDGGDYTISVRGEHEDLDGSTGVWVNFDVTNVYKSLFYSSPADVENPGMILTIYSVNPGSLWYFYSSNNASYRPVLKLTYPTLERISITGITEPYSDTFAYPIPFKGKWYVTMNTIIENPMDGLDHCTVCLLQMDQSTTDGLAEATITNINDKLLRMTPGNQTPYPGSSGTPYPAFRAPYVQFSPIPTQTPYPPADEWYGRMAGISSAYVEYNSSPTPSPVKIHAFFHAEDNHDFDGESYGKTLNNLHINYARIGYAISNDGLAYTQINASASNTNKPGPVVRSYMSERDWKYPPYGTPLTVPPGEPTPTPGDISHGGLEHGPGVRHPWIIKRGDYLYLFYDKIDTLRFIQRILYVDNYPTLYAQQPTPNPTFQENLRRSLKTRESDGMPIENQSLCLSRSSYNDFIAYDASNGDPNPWYNYFDGSFSQVANGGWSSPLINKQLQNPSVTYNAFLDEYTMLSDGYVTISATGYTVVYLYIAENNSFSSWSEGIRFDVSNNYLECPTYGYFVNTEANYGKVGSVTVCGQNPFLYYLSGLNQVVNERRTSRVKIKFFL